MAENDSMEEKDIAKEQKQLFEERVKEAMENLKEGHTKISIEGIELTNYGGRSVYFKIKGN